MSARPEHAPWFPSDPHTYGTVEVAGRTWTIAEPFSSGHEGQRLWPAAVAMASRVACQQWVGLKVCEVGAGLGLPGMVAASLGATVTLIDREPDVAATQACIQKINGIKLENVTADWSADAGRTWDVILGSEVVYPLYDPAALAAFIARHWSGKQPCWIVVSDPSHLPAFAEALDAHGLLLSCRELTDTHSDGRPFTVHLCRIGRG